MRISRIIPQTQASKFRSVDIPVFDDHTGKVFGIVKPVLEGELVDQDSPIPTATEAPAAATPKTAPEPESPPRTDTYEELARQKPEPLPEIVEAVSEETLAAMEAEARDKGKQAGLIEGREEGHEAGYQAGLEQAKEEYRASIEQVMELLNTLETRVSEQDQQLEPELAELTISIARRVLQRELHVHPNHILHAVRQGLAALPSQQGHVRVFLHPDDLSNLNEHLPEGDTEHSWALVEDPDMSPGSYRLESGNAELSLDLEQRLNEVIDAALMDDTVDVSP